MSQKIAVLGTGANGASIAADLTNAGLDVVLIEQWPAHVEAMRENGVRIEMPDETVVTPVRAYHLCEVCTFDEPFDVVLLLMKAYDTPWACKLIEPILAPDGLVVGVQNGMSVDAIAEAVGPERTMGCVIEISSQMFEPGIIQRQSPHDRSWFAVGAIHEAAKGREGEIQEILSHSGTTVIASDIRSAKWMKLISNCTTLATTAIFGVPIAEAANNPGMREMMVRSGTEALKAGQDLDYRIEPIFGLTEDDVLQTNQLVELLLDKLTSTYIMDNTITTVLQDHMKNRKSEVGDVNGWVVAEQEKLGKKAPVNAAIVEISARIKRGEVEPGPENLELLKELVAE
ncbi:MAG: 2-dehydropantoate 2-reductase [Alphaproteobacteria bacterium]|nr:2-dehydropantoate 2-reductase [Alphaproteobacteria bacterium]